MAAHLKYLYPIILLGILFLASCGVDPYEAGEIAEIREGATESARAQADLDAYRDAQATEFFATLEAEEEATIDAMVEADHLTRVAEEASLSDQETPTPTISWEEAAAHVGEVGTVCGPVAGTAYRPDENGEPTFLNVGQDYPSPSRFTIVIWGEDRGNFSEAPEDAYRNVYVCATGTIEAYRGVAQIQVSQPTSLALQ